MSNPAKASSTLGLNLDACIDETPAFCRKTIVNWIWLGFVLVVFAVALSADEVKKPRGAFSKLRISQQVTMRQEPSGFTISYFDDDTVPLTHKVIEIGEDHIVVEDIAATRETTIPVYALRSIEKLKTRAK